MYYFQATPREATFRSYEKTQNERGHLEARILGQENETIVIPKVKKWSEIFEDISNKLIL